MEKEREIVKLPDWEGSDIDPAKVCDYLLSPTHPVGRFKVPFFASLGYTLKNWQVLQTDLRNLVREKPPRPAGRNYYGEKYTVWGRLTGPSGLSGGILTVWMVPLGEDVPRFVTACPREEE